MHRSIAVPVQFKALAEDEYEPYRQYSDDQFFPMPLKMPETVKNALNDFVSVKPLPRGRVMRTRKLLPLIRICLSVLLVQATTCYATSMHRQLPLPAGQQQADEQLDQILADLNTEEIEQIDIISKKFGEKRIQLEQKLNEVQKAFNQQLRHNSDEQTIRAAFTPIAKAMENIAVNQIMMMQEINTVISTHLQNKAELGEPLTSTNKTIQ